METELNSSQDFYLNAIDIYKVLSMNSVNRNGSPTEYLNDKFNTYSKLMTNSNVVERKINDKLCPIKLEDAKIGSPINGISRPHSRAPSDEYINIQV